jgi:hypothetical protein
MMRTQQSAYEIRIEGPLDDIRAAAFSGMAVTCPGQVTIITGEFDQAALHGLLERIRLLGLNLVEARRVSGTRRRVAQ